MALGGVERILRRARLRRGTMVSRGAWSSMVKVVAPKYERRRTYSVFADPLLPATAATLIIRLL
jgi:hypothetical protein